MNEPEPQPTGRRARNQAARQAFKTARDRGLILRHRAKLQHLRERAGQSDTTETTTEQP